MLISLERIKNLDNSAQITIFSSYSQIIHCKQDGFPAKITFYPSNQNPISKLNEKRLNYSQLVEFINQARFVEIY